MGSLTAILVLTFVGYSFEYSVEPSLSWPEEYHFRAEELDLTSNIVKPFEIWYSTENNRSRIDFYGGTVSRYYYGAYEYGAGKIYMIHPQVAEDDSETEVKCEILRHYNDQKDFLPDLYDFEYEGTQEHDGKEVHVWKRTDEMSDVISREETLLVEDLDGGVGIPLHHFTKMWNSDDGSLEGDVVINYYNYDDNVVLEDLDAENKHDCQDWVEFTQDFYEAVKVLHPTIESDVDLAFHRFKRHHFKDYVDKEHYHRRAIFRRNWNMIVNHNNKKLSYTLGLNQFADKTMSELAYLSGVKAGHGPIRAGTHPFPHTEQELASMVEEFPRDFDLRTEGVISPVRTTDDDMCFYSDQASCGSCWAFATAATLEGAIGRVEGGRIFDLSEQSLVDCAWAFRSHGCQGTEAIDAVYEYVLRHGIPTVEEYGPYLEEDGVCKINNMTNLYTIKGFVGITRNSPNALKAALYKYGPVTVAVQVTEKMAFYKTGVFYDFECVPQAMNHAVTAVGYGVRDGEPYWIIKNSWGESWGESGYILMAANENNCNVMTSPYYPVL